MRMFGMQKARRMLLTGEPIGAQEAYRLRRRARGGAARASCATPRSRSPRRSPRKSAKAVQLAKWSLNGIELLDVKQSYRFEQGFTFELYTSPDSQEARDAFVEKRDAKFARRRRGDS